jgi:hypothetical protein
MQRNSKPATAKLVPESSCKAFSLMATLCGNAQHARCAIGQSIALSAPPAY